MALRPDGGLLAAADDDGNVHFYDPVGWRAEGPALRSATKVRALAFSPDGLVLVSAGEDGAVRRWDVAARRAAGAPLPHRARSAASIAEEDGGLQLLEGARRPRHG